ncbi:hypothetical protein E2I00_017350 [Balaenoptera physalus]|uniref:G-protein coupled receptors family 1 profile domain-containing protein n=1 Tax=Balaenoptera physalus TaxID=9770 RepID=A0A643C3E9_BALPH|nr:hypothetical protein E2I00_017350 [Balaenoptera physalus]
MGFSLSLVQAVAIFRLPFCKALIEHFFCDVQPVLDLACATTIINDILTLIISILVITGPATFFISYVLIISTILKIASTEGRKKTFAICASYLTVVMVHYGCASTPFAKPKSENTKDDLSDLTVITPLLNPVVCSLRNEEVQEALWRVVGCATQMFFIILAINNCFLLTAMGHDCYVAICNPLSILVILVPMGLVFISYILIISTILKIAFAKGQKKAFATGASHLTVFMVHYGCASIAYLKPKLENTKDQDQLISVTYIIITPLLNPVVYTLRNKEVKDALLWATGRKLS